MIKLPLILHQSNATLNFLSFFLFFLMVEQNLKRFFTRAFSLSIYIYIFFLLSFIYFIQITRLRAVHRTHIIIHIGEMMRNLMLLLRGSLVWKKGKIAICNNLFFFFFFLFSFYITFSARNVFTIKKKEREKRVRASL